MSTATFTTLGAPGGTVPTETLRRGSLRALANINGIGVIAVRNSFNVSSITDNGVGLYGFNLTQAFASNSYPVVSMGALNRRGQYRFATLGASQSTSLVELLNTDNGTTAQDDDVFNMMAGSLP